MPGRCSLPGLSRFVEVPLGELDVDYLTESSQSKLSEVSMVTLLYRGAEGQKASNQVLRSQGP